MHASLMSDVMLEIVLDVVFQFALHCALSASSRRAASRDGDRQAQARRQVVGLAMFQPLKSTQPLLVFTFPSHFPTPVSSVPVLFLSFVLYP